jgi:RNA polymerase sigma-70 factor (ECF subfamily)
MIVVAGSAAAYRSLTDERLMSLVKADDGGAFEALYARHEAKALAVARSIHYNRDSAQDIVQDAFLDLWRTRARYDEGQGAILSWVMTMVRHRAIDAIRRTGTVDRMRTDGAQEPDAPLAPGDLVDRAIEGGEARELRSLVRRLPLLQREVILLGYFGGLSHTEIASDLRLPLGTVKGRMRLGINRLRAGMVADPLAAGVDVDTSLPCEAPKRHLAVGGELHGE